MGLIMLGTIIISYFILRGLFKNLDKDSKDLAPIGWLLLVMFIPFANVIVSGLLYFTCYFMNNPIDKVKFIDKFFLLRDK